MANIKQALIDEQPIKEVENGETVIIILEKTKSKVIITKE